MNDIRIFNNEEFGEVRTVIIGNEPWFVVNDAAIALGYTRGRNSLKHIDDDDKRVAPIRSPLGGGEQDTYITNESGLYSLIFSSKLPSAKKFKRWVTSEVLPQLRKTGGYKVPQTIPEQIQLLAQGYTELDKKVDTITERLDKIELDLPILPIEAERITTAARKRGVSVLGGKTSAAYKNRAVRQKVYNNLYWNLKYNFSVTTYRAIKRNQCDKAVDIINRWEPPVFLAEEIEQLNN